MYRTQSLLLCSMFEQRSVPPKSPNASLVTDCCSTSSAGGKYEILPLWWFPAPTQRWHSNDDDTQIIKWANRIARGHLHYAAERSLTRLLQPPWLQKNCSTVHTLHTFERQNPLSGRGRFSCTLNKTTSSRNSRNRVLAGICSLYCKINSLHTFCTLSVGVWKVSATACVTRTYWRTQLFPWFCFGVNLLCVVQHQVHVFIKALKISNKSSQRANSPGLNFSNNNTNYH